MNLTTQAAPRCVCNVCKKSSLDISCLKKHCVWLCLFSLGIMLSFACLHYGHVSLAPCHCVQILLRLYSLYDVRKTLHEMLSRASRKPASTVPSRYAGGPKIWTSWQHTAKLDRCEPAAALCRHSRCCAFCIKQLTKRCSNC